MRVHEASLQRVLGRALSRGSVAGLLTMAAVALAGMRERRSGIGPINATSHVIWGDEAGTTDVVDLKHTLPGVLINGGAGVFWALAHELLRSRVLRGRSVPAVASGAAVAGLAYLVDYHLIPRRLSPGWELRLSRGSVALGFVALGLGLVVAELVRPRSTAARSVRDGHV
jgi:hypothetical protein